MKTNKIEKLDQAKKSKKKVKQPKTKFEKGCIATLAIQIIFVVLLFSLLLIAPLIGLFGGLVFVFFIVAAICWTIGSLGIGWLIPEAKTFFGNTWKFMEQVFNSTEAVKNALQPHIIWLTVLLFVISTCGFICNAIYYFKKEKKNKGKFITSCVFLGVGFIIMALTIILYFAK